MRVCATSSRQGTYSAVSKEEGRVLMFDLYPATHTHPRISLEKLFHLRRHPVLLLCGSNLFSSQTTFLLYALLRQLGPQEALDVVFQSPGGDPMLARRLAILLRSYTRQLTILVLHEVHSAGALFCLAADELIMNPLSVLGPIDPQVPGSLPENGARASMARGDENRSPLRNIATEEVRLFREMARNWFGVGESVEERLSLLHTFSQRVFPTTLTAFYRADQEMRQAADELLRYHQPDATIRQHISDQLVGGSFSHAHAIHCEEARGLGLPVRHANKEEEDCLWHLLDWTRAYFSRVHIDPIEPEQQFTVGAVLVTDTFAAHDVRPLSFTPPPVTPAPGIAPAPDQPQQRQSRRWGWRQIPLDALEISFERDLCGRTNNGDTGA